MEEPACDKWGTQLAKPQEPMKIQPTLGGNGGDVEEWADNVDEVSQQIKDILDGTITDFEEFDRKLNLKDRAKEIRVEEAKERRERFFLMGTEGKGEGTRYKWWCKRCFVEYRIDLDENKCSRCKQSDKMMTQEQRREELLGKLDVFKEEKNKHQWRKDKWLRWKKSQAMLKRSKNTNYKAWEYWEPDTESEDEGDPIVPRDNPEFLAMEADMKQKQKKTSERTQTANKCRERGNQCMKESDFIGAIEHYEEALEYSRSMKAVYTNKALAQIKIFRYHDAIASCNKVIEYAEIFEDGFTKSPDACFKAFIRRATALRALQKWDEALEDIEDALKICPKDKDALTLYEKTKTACDESKAVQEQQTAPPATDDAPEPAGEPASASPAEPEVKSEGPVRVEIEESDEEEDVVSAPNPESLGSMSKQDFNKLLKNLKSNAAERTRFCSRKQGTSHSYANKDQAQRDKEGRKCVIKVEEVPDASGLDNALKDAERCCILWKKHKGTAVQLSEEAQALKVKNLDPDEAREEADALNFVRVTMPRVLEVLFLLASSNEMHCELTSSAVRHVWPFLASDPSRHRVLELLHEWSQCSVSSRALAEFASRYPKPHFHLLIEAVTTESKENIMPPNFEETARAATERLKHGEQGVEAALEDMLAGLSRMSAAELAVSTLGNLAVAGAPLPTFKAEISAFCDEIVNALCRQLRPLDWRLCGRAAGTIANVLRLGSNFVDAVQETCLEPIVTALREEAADKGPMAEVQKLGAGLGNGGLPFVKATSRLLSALINFVVVRPSGWKRVHELGVLEIIVPLMELQNSRGANIMDNEDPAVTATRAITLASRLVREAPEGFSVKMEADILRRTDQILEKASCNVENPASLESVDLALRILTALVTKREGVLDRLTGKANRCQELPDGVDLEDLDPAVPFVKLIARLMKLARSLNIAEHATSDDEGTATSRIRGNLALVFAKFVEVQADSDASRDLKALNFEPLVPLFIDWLRKERGPVQQNIGVCLTRLASNPQYRQAVRDLNGIESLHQIMLPKVEKASEANQVELDRLSTDVESCQSKRDSDEQVAQIELSNYLKASPLHKSCRQREASLATEAQGCTKSIDTSKQIRDLKCNAMEQFVISAALPLRALFGF